MFGISFEHILIVGIILVVLGPKRLPEMGNSVGKAIKNFKDSISGLHEEPKVAEKVTPEKIPTEISSLPAPSSLTSVIEPSKETDPAVVPQPIKKDS